MSVPPEQITMPSQVVQAFNGGGNVSVNVPGVNDTMSNPEPGIDAALASAGYNVIGVTQDQYNSGSAGGMFGDVLSGSSSTADESTGFGTGAADESDFFGGTSSTTGMGTGTGIGSPNSTNMASSVGTPSTSSSWWDISLAQIVTVIVGMGCLLVALFMLGSARNADSNSSSPVDVKKTVIKEVAANPELLA